MKYSGRHSVWKWVNTLILIPGLVIVVSITGYGQDVPKDWTFTTGTGSGTFGTASNWVESGAPPSGNNARDDTFIFGNVYNASTLDNITVTLDQGSGNPKTQNMGNIRFTSSADSYTFNGASGASYIIDLYGDGTANNIGIENLSSNAQIFNVPFDVNDNQLWNSGSTDNGGNLVFNGEVTLVSSEKTVTLTGYNDFIFNANVTNGTGNEVNLQIAGNGNVVMGASSIIDGINLINISSGTLLLSADGQVNPNNGSATNSLNLNGGVFNTGGYDAEFNGTLTLTENSSIDLGSGSSVIEFAETTFSDYTGAIYVYGYTGNFGYGYGTDRIIFDTFLDDTPYVDGDAVPEIQFYLGGDTYVPGKVIELDDGRFEIVPIAAPEPGTIFVVLLLAGFVGWRERGRLVAIIRSRQV